MPGLVERVNGCALFLFVFLPSRLNSLPVECGVCCMAPLCRMALTNEAPLKMLYDISHWFCTSLHINLLASQLPAVVSKLGRANVEAEYEPHQAIRMRIWPNAVSIPERVDLVVQQKLRSAHSRLASPQHRPAQSNAAPPLSSSAPPHASRAALALSNRPVVRTAGEAPSFFLHIALDARRKLAVSSNPALVLPGGIGGAHGLGSAEHAAAAVAIPLELVTRACRAATLPAIVTWALSTFASQRCRQIFNFLTNIDEPSACTVFAVAFRTVPGWNSTKI
jgi:hypothetical protein